MNEPSFVGTCLQDARYGFRILRRSPAFTAIAIATLALGIGANTAIFSVVYAVLFHALPYTNPSQLVWVTDQFPKMHAAFVPHPSFFAWRDDNRVFSGVSAYEENEDYNLTNVETPERLSGVAVSANLFYVLGVQPILGRSFLPNEDLPGGSSSVILTHGLWAGHFGSSTTVVGQSITLNEESYQIIGVLPVGFRFPVSSPEPQLFTLLKLQSHDYSQIHRVNVIARLKAGVTRAQSLADLSVIEHRTLARYPGWFSRFSQEATVEVIPLHEKSVGNVRPALLALLCAAAFVLLIASANVANLQLARGWTRQREMGVRAVLGASVLRIIQQLLTESAILALLGGCVGLCLAFCGLAFLRSIVPVSVVQLGNVKIESAVLIFTVLVTLLTALLAGLAPAMVVSSSNLNEKVKGSEAQAGVSRSRHYLRNLLVAAELAAAIVLLGVCPRIPFRSAEFA